MNGRFILILIFSPKFNGGKKLAERSYFLSLIGIFFFSKRGGLGEENY